MNEINQELFEYISACPTAYQAAAHTADLLEAAGYTRLCENDGWKLLPGHGYFVTRNFSSLIAFRLPGGAPSGYMISAAHGDSPCFKIKESAELSGAHYTRLSAERYGGMLCASWMDRPLSIAGRVVVRAENGIETRFADLREPAALIPNVAIHMNRAANDGMSYNAAVDMIPLSGESGAVTLRSRIAENIGCSEEDILTTDLFAYNPQPGIEWNGFVSSPRLDDLQCAFASLKAFLSSGVSSGSAAVYCLFDNEEVGSMTKQGAASTFLSDVLERIGCCMGLDREERLRALGSSCIVSCDNAHAVHPNHPEYMDPNHAVYMNGGVVIKYNASQKYSSDAVSAAIFRLVCEKAGVPFQHYANRADMPGGSTLGNIANSHVSVNTVDIGLAQLAMHSAFETAGADDTRHMINALTAFFGSSLRMSADGRYDLI